MEYAWYVYISILYFVVEKIFTGFYYCGHQGGGWRGGGGWRRGGGGLRGWRGGGGGGGGGGRGGGVLIS